MGWGALSGSLVPLYDLLKRDKPLSTLNAYPPCRLCCAFWLAGSLVRLSKVRQTIIDIEHPSPTERIS